MRVSQQIFSFKCLILHCRSSIAVNYSIYWGHAWSFTLSSWARSRYYNVWPFLVLPFYMYLCNLFIPLKHVYSSANFKIIFNPNGDENYLLLLPFICLWNNNNWKQLNSEYCSLFCRSFRTEDWSITSGCQQLLMTILTSNLILISLMSRSIK